MKKTSAPSFVGLILLVSSVAAHAATYPEVVLADSPIAYFRFNNDALPTASNSGSLGSAADGTYQNSAVTGDEAPRPPDFLGFEADNTALQLDGTDGSVTTSAGFLNGMPRFTISGWIRRAADQPNRTGLWGQNDLIEFGYINNTTLECWTDSGLDVTPVSIPNEQWAHVAIVSEGSPGTLTMYVNGLSVGSRNHVLPANTTFPFNIGGGGVFDGSGNFFNGQIDEVAVYDKALSPEKIANQYFSVVPTPPTIIVQPQPAVFFVGGTLTLSVSATGSPVLLYQWSRSGTPLSGKTAATLVIDNVSLSDSGSYSVQIKNGFGTADSDPVDVTVKETTPPSITQEPASLTRYAGAPKAIFTVVATGGSQLTYQWQKGGSDLPSQTNTTLTLNNVQASDQAQYRVKVSNTIGNITSQPATLTILVPTPGSYEAAVVGGAPVAYWRLGESDGTTAFDFVGGNDGTYNGGVTLGAEGALLGNADLATDFNGTDAYVSTPLGLNGYNLFTIHGWMRRAADQQNRTGLWGQNDLIEFGYINNNTLECWTDNGLDVSPNPIPNEEWAHLAIVADGSPGTVTMYINGAAAGSRAHVLPGNNAFKFNIGGGGVFDGTGNFFIGRIDDVAVYNRPLSATEICGLYQAGSGIPLSVQIDQGGNVLQDTKPAGPLHHANDLGATWLASDTGGAVTRQGVMQFVADSGSQITLAADADFNSSQGTITFFVRSSATTGAGNDGAMLVDRRTGVLGDVIVQNDDGAIFVQARDAAGVVNQFSAGQVNDGLWHHVAYVYDQSASGSTTIYIDGAQAGTQAPTRAWSWDPAQRIELGRSHDGYWKQLDGSLDDFRIYNRILTASEIGAAAGSGDLVDTAALKVRLNFDTPPTGLTLTWSCGVLQSADALIGNGPGTVWTDLLQASSPYSILPSKVAQFYRVR